MEIYDTEHAHFYQPIAKTYETWWSFSKHSLNNVKGLRFTIYIKCSLYWNVWYSFCYEGYDTLADIDLTKMETNMSENFDAYWCK